VRRLSMAPPSPHGTGPQSLLFASDDETEEEARRGWGEGDESSSDDEGFFDAWESQEELASQAQGLRVAALRGATTPPSPGPVKQRHRLASYKAFGEVSVWSFLKQAVGQDLTRITFPVAFNEPLTLIQRSCEDMEYSHLLDLAAAGSGSERRLLFVAAFAMSNYVATCGRLGKPFNPLLHETFEHTQPPDGETGLGGFRFLAEQVGHHPPVSASHAESLQTGRGGSPPWEFWADWQVPRLTVLHASHSLPVFLTKT
jgi:hypothetical protein